VTARHARDPITVSVHRRVEAHHAAGRRTSRRLPTGRPVTIVVLATGLVLGGGGAAFAYWRTAGVGSGSATTGAAVVLTTEAVTVDGLYPGHTVAASTSVTNPGPASVTIKAASAPVVASDTEACASSNVVFTPAASLDRPISAGTTAAVAIGTLTMGVNAPSACQGAQFTMTVTITGQQQ